MKNFLIDDLGFVGAHIEELPSQSQLRNIIIHRHEFSTLTMSITFVDMEGSFTNGHPFSISFREAAEQHIKKIAPNSIISSPTVDPILFHSELWEKLVSLIEHVCEGCYPQIDFFVSEFLSP